MKKRFKITKCPSMPAVGYSGVINGNDNPFNVISSEYYDDNYIDDTIEYINNYEDHKKMNKLKNYEKETLSNWENHFNDCVERCTNAELPRPVMVGCNPYFSGGLFVQGEDFTMDGKETLSDLDCNHVKIDRDIIRNPNNQEYDRYFRKHYANQSYRIKTLYIEGNNKFTKTANGTPKVLNHCMVVKNNYKKTGIDNA